jgi:predicted transcriptional regulator of viral defense system
MARRSVVEMLESVIVHRLDAETSQVFTVKDFRQVYGALAESLDFPQVLTFKAFCRHFEARGLLKVIMLEFPWRTFTRFVWKDGPGAIQVVSTLDPSGYFSHFSAARILGLTLQNPKDIYFNVEQSPKPAGDGLSQTTIDRAFKGNPRTSKQVAIFGDHAVHYLMGKNTENLGVIESDSGVKYTDIERTLIDIAVRPVHCGGIDEVFRVYQTAAREFNSQISINKLRSYLNRIKHVYPYHQSIGYLLDAGGFQSPILSVMKEDISEFNFYLDYGIKDAAFDAKWKVFIPKHFPVMA